MRSVFLSVLVLFGGCSFVVSGSDVSADAAAPDSDLGMPIDASMMTTTTDAAMMGATDLAGVTGPSAWRKSITIDNTKVGGALTDFPVWIDLTDADIAAHAQADGQDIYFTAADGTTKLDHELQSWNAASHRLLAWVRVPTLGTTAPTVIYVDYGNANAGRAQNAPGVFKSSFAAVWHLDDAVPTTAIADATGTHAGSPSLTAATTKVSAKLGGGLSFTGSNDSIGFVNPLTGNKAHTISVWVNQAAVTHPSAVLVVGTPMTSQSRWLYTHFTSAVLAVGYYSNDWPTTTNLDSAGWTLLHWVLEGANGKNHLYQNGVEITGSPQTING
ncbi:MAG: DUF2341 domain-containing protein, partial [Polyangia bacterium]